MVSWGRGPGLLLLAAGRRCAPVCLQHTKSGRSCWSPSCAVQAAPPAMAALLLEDLCGCPDSSLLRGNSFSEASAQGDGSATVTCIGPGPQ